MTWSKQVKMIIPSYEEIKVYISKSEELDRKINIYLENSEYEFIYTLFDDKEICLLTNKNQRAYLLWIIARLLKYEIDSTGETSLKGRNTSEIIRIYKIISLYLRRIEFAFPIDLQKELLIYLQQEKVSLELLIGIIMNNTKIIHKEEIITQLSRLVGEEK